jgi:ankyrin repeat protein
MIDRDVSAYSASNNINETFFQYADTMMQVFSHLLPEQIFLLALINKNFNDLINNRMDSLWEKKRSIHFPHTAAYDKTSNLYKQFQMKYKDERKSIPLELRPLFSMASEGFDKQLEKLVLRDEQIDNVLFQTRDMKGESLSTIAIKNKNQATLDYFYKLVKKLFSKRNFYFIDTNNIDPSIRFRNLTVLYYALLYRQTLDEIKLLFLKGSSANEIYPNGMCPLHVAAQSGLVDIAAYLLEQSPQALNQRDASNQTPLMFACSMGQEAMLSYLLNQANIDLSGTSTYQKPDIDTQGWTAFHWAVGTGYSKLVELLIAHHQKQPFLSDEILSEASILAITKGYLSIAKTLREHFPTLNNQEEKFVEAYLQAAKQGKLDTLKALLNYLPKLLNQTDLYGQTALIWAATNNQLAVVEYLMAQKSIDLLKSTHDASGKCQGWTALHWAASKGRSKIVDLFLMHPLSNKLSTSALKNLSNLSDEIQGKLELCSYINQGKYNSSLFGQSEQEKKITAARLNKIVFYTGTQTDYKKLLEAFKERYADDLNNYLSYDTLGRIYKKLGGFLDQKIWSLPLTSPTPSLQSLRK